MMLMMNVRFHTTSWIDECTEDVQFIPGVYVLAEMNRKVRKLFERMIGEYIRFHSILEKVDKSSVVDLETFMDNYEE